VTFERLLNDYRVAVAPGEGFGASGRGFARFSLATQDEALDEGLVRLRRALGRE
jgi:L-glutamine---4-(methylsulfanyl)-2-oxobutanoate aminotransferase